VGGGGGGNTYKGRETKWQLFPTSTGKEAVEKRDRQGFALSHCVLGAFNCCWWWRNLEEGKMETGCGLPSLFSKIPIGFNKKKKKQKTPCLL